MIIFEVICTQCVKMVLSEFLCEKNAKYKGEIFVSSDFAHIYRVARTHSGSDSV